MSDQLETRLRKFRPDVDGLRALAITMVVVWHAGLINIHGGVIVSFVLSGFLIGSQLLAEVDKTSKVSLGKFWARRLRRLAPGMAIVVTATIVFSWLFASPLRFREYATDGLFAVFSVLNWRLAENGTDYFQNNGTQTPYQHFWSLGIEEQFYLVFPLILVAVVWMSRKLFRNRALVAVFLVAVIGVSYYFALTQTYTNQPLAYFGAHTHAWELAVGVLLALGAQMLSRMNLVVAAIMSWAGLAIIIATGMLITNQTPLPGFAFTGTVAGTAMVIAGGCANPTFGAERLLGLQVFKQIANVSYGWYLWHWPVLILWPSITGRDLAFADRLRVLFVSLLLAVVMYYAVEKRIRENKRLVVVPRRGLALGGAFSGATAALLCIALVAPLNMAPTTATASTNATVGLGSVQAATKLTELPGNVQPPLLQAQDDIANFGCIDQLKDAVFTVRSGCVIGDLGATRTMVVLGDSHAWQWGDAFNEIGIRNNLRVTTMTKSGCSAMVYAIRNDQLGRDYTECTSWRESALKAIENLRPEIVVVTGRARREGTQEGAEATFKRLQTTGAKVVYLTDTPLPGSNVPDCLATHSKSVLACSTDERDAIELADKREQEKAAAQKHGASIVDVLPAFCAESKCPPVIEGRVVYFDNSHITATYAVAVVPFLEQKLQSVL